MKQHHRSLLLSLSLVAASACAQAPLSADDHLERAGTESARAAEHASRYDDDAVDVRVVSRKDGAESVQVFNPTHFEKVNASAHDARAHRHLAAAEALERSEDAACVGVPPAARAACPLLLTSAVVDIGDGVRVTFDDDAAASRAAAVVRCQQAFATTRAYEDLPSCALYGRGLQLRQQGPVLELTAKDDGDVARLRANVRGHHPAP